MRELPEVLVLQYFNGKWENVCRASPSNALFFLNSISS